MSSQGEYYGVQKIGDKWHAMYDIEQGLMGGEFDSEEEAQTFVNEDMAKHQPWRRKTGREWLDHLLSQPELAADQEWLRSQDPYKLGYMTALNRVNSALQRELGQEAND